MSQHPHSVRWNERRRNDDKKAKILRLARSGLNQREISEVLTSEGDRTSRQRVGAILREGLRQAAAERKDIALELFDLELDRLAWIIQQSTRVVSEPCKECKGQGVFQNDEHCDVCRGDGKANHPDVRLRAMKEIRSAVHQRAQMLGLYAPEKFALTDVQGNDLRPELRRELESMSIDDLDQSIADFQAGVEAATATFDS